MGEQLAPCVFTQGSVPKWHQNNNKQQSSDPVSHCPFQRQGLILPLLGLPFVFSLTSQILNSDQESTTWSLCGFRILQLITNRLGATSCFRGGLVGCVFRVLVC